MKHKADIEGWWMKLASPVASWLGLCDSEQYLNESNEFGNSNTSNDRRAWAQAAQPALRDSALRLNDLALRLNDLASR